MGGQYGLCDVEGCVETGMHTHVETVFVHPTDHGTVETPIEQLAKRIAALESLTAWVNDPTPTDEVSRQLAEIRQAILWVLKQPWEKDFASWEELVKAVTKDSPKALRFREEVVTPPPVRDVL